MREFRNIQSPTTKLTNLTEKLKADLWRRYGDPSYPAEWDGNIYGGGKLSQRFWEYYEVIEFLELTPDSVVLDIGGGSPATGAGFFARVITPHVKEVHIMDLNIGESKHTSQKVVFHRNLASYETLSKVLKENSRITHVACISVFEHIPHEIRCGIIQAVNEYFSGDTFVATLEFHPKECYFEHQLVSRTVSEMFASFTSFYPDVIRKSPFWCENAFYGASFANRILRHFGFLTGKGPQIPLWYPVAFRFRRLTK